MQEKKEFLLKIDIILWNSFIQTIPLSSNPTQKIIELIEKWTLDQEFMKKKYEMK